MRAQITLEFLIVTFLLLSYISGVLFLYSRARLLLERAVDRKLVERVEAWSKFIAPRPEGTQIKLEIKPYPRHYIALECGEKTKLVYTTGMRELEIRSRCRHLNFTAGGCLLIESIGGELLYDYC